MEQHDTIFDLPFVAHGVSFRETPIEILEKLALDPQHLQLALRDLNNRPGVIAGLILSTCNRVEVYALGNEQEEISKSCEQFLQHWSLREQPIATTFYNKSGRAALQHLFQVTASLDSMVPGESQILGQVKDVYEQLLAMQCSHPQFDRIMRKAISVAKRVRTDTAIAEQPVSVAYAAVELARRIFSDLSDSKVLLVGTGEMGKLAAKHLISRGIKELMVSNRTYKGALKLAEQFAATAIPFELLNEHLKEADIVIVSTAARDFIINKPMIRRLMPERFNKPIFLIDIAVPRNIDPAVNDVENVYLYNMEDLQSVVSDNLETRQHELSKAVDIVADEVEQCLAELKRRRFDATIGSLKLQLDEIVQQEIARTIHKLRDSLTPEQVEHLHLLGQSLVSTLLQHPANFLRLQADLGNDVTKVIRDAFALSEEPHETPTHRQPR